MSPALTGQGVLAEGVRMVSPSFVIPANHHPDPCRQIDLRNPTFKIVFALSRLCGLSLQAMHNACLVVLGRLAESSTIGHCMRLSRINWYGAEQCSIWVMS